MKYVFFFLQFFISFNCFSQSQEDNLLKSDVISFHDANFYSKMRSQADSFYKKSKQSNSTSNIKYTPLTDKFFEINDNWFLFSDNILVNTKKNQNVFYKNKVIPQFLNDSILLAMDGKLININNDEIIWDTIENQKVNLEILNTKQITLGSDMKIIKSDIFKGHLENKDLYFHLFKVNNSIFGNIGFECDNPNSKYIMFDKALINRYDLSQFIKIPYLPMSYGSNHQEKIFAYNDSLLYFPINEIGMEYLKIDNFNFNESLINPLKLEKENNANGYSNTDIKKRELMNAWYFFRKYNKINIFNSASQSNLNYKQTANTLLKYEPTLIVEYNFITKNVVSLLDRSFLPFGDLKSMHIDNNNRFLVVQSKDSSFTIFNLETKKVLITLPGEIVQINKKNELICNVMGKSRKKEKKLNVQNTRLDLNELAEISAEYSYSDQNIIYNFDEFTSFQEFTEKVQQSIKDSKSNLVFSNDTKISNSKPQEYTINYSNNIIKNTLSKQFRYYLNNGGQQKKEMTFNLTYSSYNFEKQEIIFSTDLKRYNYYLNFSTRGSNTVRFFDNEAGYLSFAMTDISPELAKNLKSTNCQLVLRNKQMSNIQVPNYFNFVVLINKDAYFKLLDPNPNPNKNGPDLNDKSKFNEFVPVFPEADNFYEYTIFKFDNTEIMLNNRKGL